ncbi:MAG: HAD family hydrolase [Acidobacteriota bacterium]
MRPRETGGLLGRWAAPEQIQTVFLDAGNTLVFLDFDAIADAIRQEGVSLGVPRLERAEYEARRRVDRHYMKGGFSDIGMWAHYFTWLLESAGVPEDTIRPVLERLRSEHEESNLWRRSRPEISRALERLKASGRTLAVISNSDGTCRALLLRLGLLPYLDAVYDSAEVGVEKPHAGIFLRALEELRARPGETLHMGDLEAIDVLGARRVEILPVLVDPFPDGRRNDFPVLKSVAELPGALGIPAEPPGKTHGSDSRSSI